MFGMPVGVSHHDSAARKQDELLWASRRARGVRCDKCKRVNHFRMSRSETRKQRRTVWNEDGDRLIK